MDSSKDAEYIPASVVVERFHITNKTLRSWLARDDLGFPVAMKIGKRRYFRIGDVMKWEREQAAKLAEAQRDKRAS